MVGVKVHVCVMVGVKFGEETESLIWCNNFALTVDIFLLLGGEDFREILSTLAVRRYGQKDSTQLLISSTFRENLEMRQ